LDILQLYATNVLVPDAKDLLWSLESNYDVIAIDTPRFFD
jgi:hypothetical protein